MAFIPNWSPTAYYNLGDKVFYIDIAYVLSVAGTTPGVFGVPPPSNPAAWGATNDVFQATYYKTTAQNLTSPNTDITFNGVGSWNNDGGYITHTNGTTDFTVVQTGLYQLDFNVSVLINNGTWSTTVTRSVSIDITRGTEQGVLTANGLQAVANYNQQVSGSFYLIAGDVINCRVNNPYTLGTPTPPQAQGIQNTFDLNTIFTWTFIS